MRQNLPGLASATKTLADGTKRVKANGAELWT